MSHQPFVHMLPLRITCHRALAVVAALLLVSACTPASGSQGNEPREGLEEGAVRQPIPSGVDPRMVEWRSDGVLIASSDSLARVPGYVIDSVFPPEEAMRRFRAEISGPAPTRLTGGASSRDALLRRYWALLVARDTLAMRTLVVDQGEFAYLYLPGSRELESGVQPGVSWLLLGSNSGRGLTRALRAAEGREAAVRGTTCGDQPERHNRNTLWGPCAVIVTGDAGADTVWIANGVLHRDGVFKLLSFSNPM